MKTDPRKSSINNISNTNSIGLEFLKNVLKKHSQQVENLSPEKQLIWVEKEFGEQFALTTSFGIQSAVLLHMCKVCIPNKAPKIIWVDTGYLHKETYSYAEELTKLLDLNLIIVQSPMSPARMEALYGRLWETNSKKDLEKYHKIRKVDPLESAFSKFNLFCWASGVRRGQTKNRKSMKCFDLIRNRLSIRPLLNWSKKDIFYYMQEHNLPQHPLFEKGFSTVGDWHSSGADNEYKQGRETRFNGLQQECGIHLSETNKDQK